MSLHDSLVPNDHAPAADGDAGRLLLVAMGIGRFFYTPLLPLMQREVGFGPDTAGLIASVNFVGYLLGTLAAVLVPKGRARLVVFRAALIASIATTFATGLTESVPVWLMLRGFAGVASAFVFLFAAAMVAEALAEAGENARVGWLFGGVGLGIAISGLVVRLAGGLLDWSELWMAAGLLALLPLPFILRSVKDTHLRPKREHTRVGRSPRPLPLWALFLNYSCEGFGYAIVATFIVAIVKARPGMEAVGDWVWVLVGLTGLPSCIFWSWVAGRIGFSAALGLAYVTQFVGILLPAASGAAWAALLSAIFFGGTFMAITALILAVGRQGAKGQGFAVLTAGFGLGQIAGPLAAGYLMARRANFNDALFVSAGVILIGLIFLALAVMQARAGETRLMDA
ncbi:MAG TPA: YbfB/YjiJ family MFS transporter [Micropepsaceae bacterium]|nr:YbfB/YjiJ family MFS transporter [Micropepsaceae bacterium]